MSTNGKGVPPDRDLAIEYVPPEQLKPDPKNARVHSPKQLGQIEASIGQFGFTNPILTDEHDEIIGGHARWQVAKKLKLKKVPRTIIRGLTETQKRALALADNKIALNATWDLELLKEALQEVSIEFEPQELGFEVGEIDVMLASGAADPDDDFVRAAPARPVTKRGDIWIAGLHRIGCGDSRDQGFVASVMAGVMAAAAFHDPPYNVAIDGNVCGKGRIRHAEFAMGVGEMTRQEFIRFLQASLGPSVRLSRNGAVHFICMDHRHVEEVIAAAETLYGVRLNICVWNKSNAGMGSLYRSKHEFVFVYRVGDQPHRNNVELGRHGRNRTNVWDHASVNTFGGSRRHDLALHPTVKPTSLVADAIQDVTKRGEIVLDCFLGSGATLVACERTGRACRGVEIDPRYVDVALQRLRAMTGVEPILAETGETFDLVAGRRHHNTE